MAKKKEDKALNIDNILFNCRDILRNARNAGSFFEKRDMMLTLKNKAEDLRRMGQECSVAGMLLYAKTDEVISIKHNTYSMSGNKISVATLDLNSDFGNIKKCLDDIATVCFDVKK